jgi:hypothetical protein
MKTTTRLERIFRICYRSISFLPQNYIPNVGLNPKMLCCIMPSWMSQKGYPNLQFVGNEFRWINFLGFRSASQCRYQWNRVIYPQLQQESRTINETTSRQEEPKIGGYIIVVVVVVVVVNPFVWEQQQQQQEQQHVQLLSKNQNSTN